MVGSFPQGDLLSPWYPGQQAAGSQMPHSGEELQPQDVSLSTTCGHSSQKHVWPSPGHQELGFSAPLSSPGAPLILDAWASARCLPAVSWSAVSLQGKFLPQPGRR